MENKKDKIDYYKLNTYLNNYCKTMEGSNFLLNLDYYYNLTSKLFGFLYTKLPSYGLQPNAKEEKQKHLSLLETLDIVNEYIEKRMPEYKDRFINSMQDGTINIVADPENEDISLGDRSGVDEECHRFVNAILKHNSDDPRTIIHEFVHNLNFADQNSLSRKYITEGISIYFELDMANFMLDKGYDPKDVFQDRLYRLTDLYYATSNMIQIFPILLCYEKLGPITDESFKDMEKLKIKPRPKTDSDFYGRFINSSEILLKESSIDPLKEFGYVIGTLLAYYAIDQRDEEFHQKMLNLNKMANTDIFPDMLKYLGLDTENGKELHEKLSVPLEHEMQRISKNLNKKSANKK